MEQARSPHTSVIDQKVRQMPLYMPKSDSNSVVRIRVSVDQYVSRLWWKESIKEWAKEYNIKLVWIGDSTHITNESRYHESMWHIADPHARTMFLLRWGN